MIELKNIKKVYNSKKGLPTEALKGIDLKFSEKGLTFILGKSGSGKSTLLNIIGGLDTYTSGDIIINGTSTKTFKEKDWDAYRNTYMGFVFQEFNLLDNYNVEENIKLALELQHKKATPEEIKESLNMVGLDDVSKRKTNELSGGQKQRIAISRALIKNPSIILADEPTGNLDSATSEQIFNILKKLSKEKLVIIVSHDEESAKKYADRIIKISDGLIESDTNEVKYNNKSELKMTRAHLPFFYSFKMGLNNLFKKKLKLIFSIITLVLCFLCLGVTISVNNSNFNTELYKRFNNNGPTYVEIYKYKNKIVWKDIVTKLIGEINNGDTADDLVPMPINMDEHDIEEIKKNTNLEWNESYTIYQNDYVTYGESNNDTPLYYAGEKVVNFSKVSAIDSKNLIGSIVNNDNNKIVITSYIADYIIHNGIKAKDNIEEYSQEYIYKPTDYNQLINDNIYIKINNLDYFNVSGILKVDTSKYEELKKYSSNQLSDMYGSKEGTNINLLATDMYSDISLSRIYISDTKLEEYKKLINNTEPNTMGRFLYNSDDYSDQDNIYYGFLNGNNVVYKGDKVENLEDINTDEVIINTSFLNLITKNDYNIKLNEYLSVYPDSNEETFLNTYITNNNLLNKKIKSNIADNKIYISFDNYKEYSISGITIDTSKKNIIYFAKNNINELINPTVSLNYVYRYVDNLDELKEILKSYPLDNSDKLLSCLYTGNIEDNALSQYIFELVAKAGSIAFGVMSLIFLTNFISTSIKLRKKEIGIFRALGCSSKDVLKIFIYECLFLLLICIIISSILLPIICDKINSFVRTMASINYNVAMFDINCILFILISAIIITIVISFLGMFKIIKQKPIDTILDK